MLKILVAQDAAMIRGALVALIELEPDLKVVAEVDKDVEILPTALLYQPDVAIIDVDQPGFDGLTAATQLDGRLPSCRTLILTSLGRPGLLRAVLSAPAGGFILKDAPPSQLAAAIRNVASGRRSVSADFVVPTWSSNSIPLSPREHSVLRLAGDGAEPSEIADAMHLSIGTVRNYLTTIVAKLHARNRVDAIRKAYEIGWLP